MDFEFKVIVVEGRNVRWEEGANRCIAADSRDLGSGLPVDILVNVTCHWSQTQSTALALVVPQKYLRGATC